MHNSYRNIKIFLLIFLAFVLVKCAQRQPLSGGVKDSTPAQIDTTKTFPRNGQLNFEGKSMVIAFDEYVKLENPNKNITLAPTFEEKVNYNVQGKELIVEFPEAPQPNTTYRLSIDGGIVDYHEGNDSLYTFVFSSGDYIDSACIQGVVKDAYTNDPVPDAYVLVYHHENIDSIQERRANYFTKTDKKGAYKIENMKPGSYEVIALKDQNQSRTYDLQTESIGFTKEKLIQIPTDSCAEQDFKLSVPQDTTHYIQNVKQRKDGAVGFSINNWKDYTDVRIENLSDSPGVTRDQSMEDSIVLWPDTLSAGNMRLAVSFGDKKDTISTVLKDLKSKAMKFTNNLFENSLLPGDTLTLQYNQPIKKYRDTLFHAFKKDSVPMAFQYIRQSGVRTLKIKLLKQVKKPKIIIDSAAVVSEYGKIATEKTVTFSYMKKTDYSSIIIEVDSNLIGAGFIQLYDDKDNIIRQASVTQKEVRFDQILSKQYFVRFVFDRNGNNRWDSGNYKTRRSPENVYYLDQTITPKKGWEQKIKWRIVR